MHPDVFAIIVLALIVASLAAWAIVRVARPPFGPLEWLVYFGCYLLARVLWRASASGPLPVPPGKGAVIVANHRSSVDPFFVQLAADRLVHWMVAREYVQHPAFGWFLRMGQVIPTNRAGIDTAATREAIRWASQGGLVGMLPEGRINMSDQLLLPVRPGATLIALRARVPVVPCYIHGAPYGKAAYSPLFMPAKVHIVFGQPIDLSPYYGREREQDVLNQLTLRVMSEVVRLAGDEDFQPQLAGRRWKPTQEGLESMMAESDKRKQQRAGFPIKHTSD